MVTLIVGTEKNCTSVHAAFSWQHYLARNTSKSWKYLLRGIRPTEKFCQKMTLQWHQAHFTNLKNVFLPTEFLWSSTVSQVSLTRYFWAGVSGITADFSVRFLEEDPQPILLPNEDTCMRFKKFNWKTISAKKISIVLADWQRFSFMTCWVWHHFYSLYGCLQVERSNRLNGFLKANNFIV